jgi:hypothetical protein
MNRIYIFFLIAFGLCACGRGRYYDKNAWLIPSEFNYYRLKGSPKRVTEYTYDGKTDTSAGRYRQYYQVYDLNREGKITDRRLVVNGKQVMVLLTTFSEDGYLIKMTDSRSGFKDTLYQGSRAVGNGWFKSFSSGGTEKVRTFLTRFWKEGEEQLDKVYEDSAADGEPVQKINSYYRGQRLLKAIVSNHDAVLEQRYFYGAGGSPDSVEWITGARVAEREVFVNNPQGDPLLYVKSKDKDTLVFQTFGYRYDDRGNWVWRRDSVGKTGKVTIMEREFVY